ncbi:MAG: hypothetical protein ACKVH1_03840 [Alphaproteobacteria bacterium]|jgi:hypothetical protein|nr:hypothetical protein [Alphaproteobacteria bacterium]
MIRLILLTFIPLLLPFVGWFVWRVFSGKPKIDPQSGDQVVPDFEKAPRGKLLAIGFGLMVVTVGAFLLFQHQFVDEPYTGIDAKEVEQQLEEEKMRLREQKQQ